MENIMTDLSPAEMALVMKAREEEKKALQKREEDIQRAISREQIQVDREVAENLACLSAAREANKHFPEEWKLEETPCKMNRVVKWYDDTLVAIPVKNIEYTLYNAKLVHKDGNHGVRFFYVDGEVYMEAVGAGTYGWRRAKRPVTILSNFARYFATQKEEKKQLDNIRNSQETNFRGLTAKYPKAKVEKEKQYMSMYSKEIYMVKVTFPNGIRVEYQCLESGGIARTAVYFTNPKMKNEDILAALSQIPPTEPV